MMKIIKYKINLLIYKKIWMINIQLIHQIKIYTKINISNNLFWKDLVIAQGKMKNKIVV